MKGKHLFLGLLFLMFIAGCYQNPSLLGINSMRGTPERNQYLISNFLTLDKHFDMSDINKHFGTPHHTEQFKDITIWYYPITGKKLIPFVFKEKKLIAYGELFFETKEWKEGKYE